jgi:hypothetical protein
MELAFCEHGLAQRRAETVAKIDYLLISPRSMAHLPGCPHKGDDPDLSHWAELNTPGAWQRLANGESLIATGGARPDRMATHRCSDCVEHGPW